MTLIPAPGFRAGDLSWEGNLVGYIDRLLLPGWLYEQNYFDPEGILSAIPAVGTALLGALTGDFLRDEKTPSKASAKGYRYSGCRHCGPPDWPALA
jgi:predicted acyltransferase